MRARDDAADLAECGFPRGSVTTRNLVVLATAKPTPNAVAFRSLRARSPFASNGQPHAGAALFLVNVFAPGQPHRTLTVREHHTYLQARRQDMKTDEFKERMHPRNGIEGTMSELVRRYGFRRSRYRGLAKTRLSNLMIGAACNLHRWCRRIEWESSEGLCAA